MEMTRQARALLQSALNRQGYDAGAVDGVRGPKTERAVAEWCLRNGSIDSHMTTRLYRSIAGAHMDSNGDPDYGRFIGMESEHVHRAKPVSGPFLPRGIVIHHTGAQSMRRRIPPERIIGGRRDLPGPLYQFGVSRDFTVDCYTNGRAHHAGMGDGAVLVAVATENEPPDPLRDENQGNSWLLGITVDHHPSEAPLRGKWTAAAMLTARICDLWGWDESRVIGHSEWTTRKTDPDFPMGEFRSYVLACLRRHRAAETSEPSPPEDYAMIGGRRYRLVPDDA